MERSVARARNKTQHMRPPIATLDDDGELTDGFARGRHEPRPLRRLARA